MSECPAKMATGNLVVTLPEIRTSDAGITEAGFLRMDYRAVVEIHGTRVCPLVAPSIEIAGEPVSLAAAEWTQEGYWIPTFNLTHGGVQIVGRVFAPLNHRGFVCLLQFSAEQATELRAGWQGSWGPTYHVTNLSKKMGGTRFGGVSSEYGSTPYIEYRGATPIFALAFHSSEKMDIDLYARQAPEKRIKRHGDGEASAAPGQAICYSSLKNFQLDAGETKTIALYIGIGLEENSAVASSVNLHRYGWETLLECTRTWLTERTIALEDQKLEKILNLNSFYNYFYSQGISLDSEDLILTSSRCSKYRGSATYNDRDAMLWSLPAVLQIDPPQARKMIEYAFTTQLKNLGVRSRFMDGTVMEPVFDLDQLCAPIRALWMYVRSTGDMSVLFDMRIQSGVNQFQQMLSARRHPKLPLFRSMLLSPGDPSCCPYMTYENVRVWRALKDVGWMYNLIRDLDRGQEASELAEEVKKSILRHCVVNGPKGLMFAWAVDLEGNYRLYDDPQTSLQLLSYLDFVKADAQIYQNTVGWIHSSDNPDSFVGSPFESPGSSRESHPSLMGIANDLLAGRTDHAVDFLRRSGLDDCIACEYVDENTGKPVAGLGFASGAGILAFALNQALRGSGAAVTLSKPEPRPADRLYQPPPPEIQDALDQSITETS